MRFIDLTTKYHITRDKIRMAVSIVSIILVCVFTSVGVYAALNAQAEAELKRRQQEARDLAADITEATVYEETSATEETFIEPSVAMETVETVVEETSETITETEATTEESTEATTESTAATTEATTEATTTTAAGPKETPYYTTVYASQSINLRSGPGVEYDVVRTLSAGDGIDVIAQTDTGWYKTYSGNYVLGRYTQSSRPTTATTAAQTTARPTAAQTTASSSSGGSNTSGMTYYGSCTVTFYGPQKRSDGTYSVTTATGTTCSQGRTCAADWGVFPAGTTIYVANDPLGGDGYYTVEDKGGAVRGSHIDIYADNAGSYSTTSRDVYIVN